MMGLTSAGDDSVVMVLESPVWMAPVSEEGTGVLVFELGLGAQEQLDNKAAANNCRVGAIRFFIV